MKTTMEHPIKKTPPVSSFFNNHKEQPSPSETPMIVREMMIYNRQLVGFGEQQVYFKECFKEYFNLEEAMSSRFNKEAI